MSTIQVNWRSHLLISLMVCMWLQVSDSVYGQRTATIEEVEWLDEINGLIETMPSANSAQHRNRYEALGRFGVLQAQADRVEFALVSLNRLKELKTPSSLPWGVGRHMIEKSVVIRMLQNGKTQDAVQFVRNLNVDSHTLEYWHVIAIHAVRNNKEETLRQVYRQIDRFIENGITTERIKAGFVRSIQLQQAGEFSISGKADDAKRLFDDCLNGPEAVLHSGFLGSTGEPRFLANRKVEDVYVAMIQAGLEKQAFDSYKRQLLQQKHVDNLLVSLPITEALVIAGRVDLARELAAVNPNNHRRAYAFCRLAELNAEQGNQIESDIDLTTCLEILKSTNTQPAINLIQMISGTYRLLGNEKEAATYLDLAFMKANENYSAIRMLVQHQMEFGIEPDLDNLLLPNRKNTSILGLLVKVAGWHETGETTTRRAGLVALLRKSDCRIRRAQ